MKNTTQRRSIRGVYKLILITLLITATASAQVGIGTTTPESSSALQIDSTTGGFVPPRMTNTQMNAIPTPLEGSIVYNTTFSALFLYSSGTWNNITRPDLPSIVLTKDWGADDDNNLVQTTTNQYSNFPLNVDEIASTEENFFTVTANGTVQVKKDGNYMITAGFSVNSLPIGGHKYIIGVYRNNTSNLIGYLVRGNVVMESDEEFGTSGVMTFPFNANDKIILRYVLNNGGTPLDARFFKIGVIKI